MLRLSITGPAEAKARRRSAFTLIEVLLVVVILGILAAVVVPQFSNASQQARENTLKDELRYLRTQLAVFTAQHNDVPPGYVGGNRAGAADPTTFVQQMTKPTDVKCAVGAVSNATFKFGPYLGEMPPNPVAQIADPASIKMIANGAPMPAPDNSTGWIYKPQTQEILPNLTGTDKDGTPFTQY